MWVILMRNSKKIILICSFFLAMVATFLLGNKIDAFALTYDYSSNGGNGVTTSSLNYNENDEVSLDNIAYKTGWTFIGWTNKENDITPLTFFLMPNEDTTLYAIFRYEPITYTASFAKGNASSVSENTLNCTIPAKYNNEEIENTCSITTPSITSFDNFDIIGFGTDKENEDTFVVGAESIYELSSNVNLYAIIKRTFEITFLKNNAENIIVSSTGNSCSIYSLNDSCNIQSFNITPKTAYNVLGWNINENDVSSNWSVLTQRTFNGTMSNNYDKTFYAITSPISYTIEYRLNNASLVNDDYDSYYNIESTITLPLVAKYGYSLVGWKPIVNTGNWNVSETYQNEVPSGKYGIITLEAILEPVEIKVIFNLNGGTSTSSYKMVSFESELGTLPTPVKNGYIFIGWFIDELFIHNVNESSLLNWNFTNEETNIYAKWDLEEITLDNIEGIEKEYDKNISNIEVMAHHNSNLPFTYKWYKLNENTSSYELTSLTSNTISLKNVSDSGYYYVSVSLVSDNLQTSTSSNVIKVSISPKKLSLINIIPNDKIEDTSTKATISGGELVGVIGNDDVSFNLISTIILPSNKVGSYSITPSAILIGNDHNNYQLEPINSIIFNIRSKDIQSKNKIVSLTSLEGFNKSYSLYFSDNTNYLENYNIENTFGKDFYARKVYQIKILDNDDEINYASVTIKVKLSGNLKKATKYKVLVLGEENVVKECKYENGYLTFEVPSSTTFAIFSNKYKDYTLLIVLSIILVLLIISCLYLLIKQNVKKKNKEEKVEVKQTIKEEKKSVHEKYLELGKKKKEENDKQKLEAKIKKKTAKK